MGGCGRAGGLETRAQAYRMHSYFGLYTLLQEQALAFRRFDRKLIRMQFTALIFQLYVNVILIYICICVMIKIER